uniref:6-phosphofructokinase n=1 Tax=Lygus hesperus TaxID=30085 RepID=A0A0A9X607_LYGHE
MMKVAQDKWKSTVEIHVKTTTDDCDIAWAALELVSARRRECRRNWISSQVDTWLGGMVSQIRRDVSSGVFPQVRNPTNHISSLQIRFNDNAVRERLMKLMGTETVKILDRNFMATLADRLSDQTWEMTRGRIEEREKWERDREKQMVMDGMIPIEDGPEGFSEHPYFAIMRQVADDVAKKKAKMEAHQVRKRMNKMIDYSSLPITFKEEMDESTLSALALIQEDGKDESIDLILDEDVEECQGLEGSVDKDKEGVLTVRYEAPEVKSLRKAKTVEEMYRLADSIFFTI